MGLKIQHKEKMKRLSRIFQQLNLGPIEEYSSVRNSKAAVEEAYDSEIGFLGEKRVFEQCGEKRCYNSRTEAERVKKHRLRRTTGGAGRLASYKCPDCHMWHLTSSR